MLIVRAVIMFTSDKPCLVQARGWVQQ